MRLHYDITLPWIRISDWTKVAKRNRWVRADVSIVIMTSQSSWIKSFTSNRPYGIDWTVLNYDGHRLVVKIVVTWRKDRFASIVKVTLPSSVKCAVTRDSYDGEPCQGVFVLADGERFEADMVSGVVSESFDIQHHGLADRWRHRTNVSLTLCDSSGRRQIWQFTAMLCPHKRRHVWCFLMTWLCINVWRFWRSSTKVAKSNRWVRADVSVVIMTSQSSWIKSSNWKKVTQEEYAAIMRSQFPLLLYYAVLVGQILVSDPQYYDARVVTPFVSTRDKKFYHASYVTALNERHHFKLWSVNFEKRMVLTSWF